MSIFYTALNFPYRLTYYSSFEIQLIIFVIGCYLLFLKITTNKQLALLKSLVATMLVFSVIGFDFVCWRTAFFPFLVYGFYSPTYLLPLFTIIWCYLASSLSLFGFFAALLVSRKELNIFSIIALAIALFWRFPVFAADYPSDALFVPLSSYNFSRTLFSYGDFSKFINIPIFFQYLNQTVLTFLLSLSIWLLAYRPKDLLRSRAVLVGLVIVATVFLGELAHLSYMPYGFFYRVVPGISVFPFVWDLTLIAVVSVFSLVLQNCKFENYIKNTLWYFIAISLLLFFSFPSLKPEVISERMSVAEKIKKTPSAFALNYWGDSILESKNKSYSKLVAGKDYYYHAQPSVGGELANLAFDNNLATRWASKGHQNGTETIRVRFSRELEVSRISLNLGSHYSDFPRGLKVEVDDAKGSRQIVFSQSNWIGPIKFTEQGLPYFGAQGVVEITLPKAVKVSTLILSQLGKDPKYDWSIAEIELFNEDSKK